MTRDLRKQDDRLSATPVARGASGLNGFRVAVMWLGFVCGVAMVLSRIVWLETRDGAGHREVALRPIVRQVRLPATRGAILARDGSPLAVDRAKQVVALHYRFIQTEPPRMWLRRQALSRLPPGQRHRAETIEREISSLRERIASLHRALAEWQGLDLETWTAQCEGIETRVEQLAQHVNAARKRAAETSENAGFFHDSPWLDQLFAPLPAAPFEPVTIAEQEAYYPMLLSPPAALLATIATSPEQFPGVKVVSVSQRDYPLGEAAAHAVGYVIEQAPPPPERSSSLPRKGVLLATTEPTRVGQSGIERSHEKQLAGRDGRAIETLSLSGVVTETRLATLPIDGEPCLTTFDAELLRDCAALLQAACTPGVKSSDPVATGGAIVVLAIEDGDTSGGAVACPLLAAVSYPTFAPSASALAMSEVAAPLVDRVRSMRWHHAFADLSPLELALSKAASRIGQPKVPRVTTQANDLSTPAALREALATEAVTMGQLPSGRGESNGFACGVYPADAPRLAYAIALEEQPRVEPVRHKLEARLQMLLGSSKESVKAVRAGNLRGR